MRFHPKTISFLRKSTESLNNPTGTNGTFIRFHSKSVKVFREPIGFLRASMGFLRQFIRFLNRPRRFLRKFNKTSSVIHWIP
eukprot:1734605-Pyramimonas_sp.AAC.1